MPGANAIVLPAGASLEHTIATQAVHTNFGTERRREAAMDYTTLGRTGLRVSVAGLGAGGNSLLGARQGLSRSQSVELVHKAFDLGVNFIDTAPNYGTEELVGDALASRRRDAIVVSTLTAAQESIVFVADIV